MELPQLVDLVLKELNDSEHAFISVRRALINRKMEYDTDLVSRIDDVLRSKSLVSPMGKDSAGFPTYSITETGRDFLKTFGTYSNYLAGVEAENRKVERVKRKQPYKAVSSDGGPAKPYSPARRSFLEENKFSILILLLVLLTFFVAYKITS